MKRQFEYKQSAGAMVGFALMLGLAITSLSCKKTEEKAKEEVAYVAGMEEYVYGFPLVSVLSTVGSTGTFGGV